MYFATNKVQNGKYVYFEEDCIIYCNPHYYYCSQSFKNDPTDY